MVTRKLFGLVVFFLSITAGYSQEFKNIIAEFDVDKIKITYDLLSDNPDLKFKVSVYGSHDNFQSPLANVIGDVGNNVLPGRGKVITWYLVTELPVNFDETIQLKLVGVPEAAAEKAVTKILKFISPVKNKKALRGKVLRIEWEGTDPGQDYILELFSGSDKRSDIGTASKDQKYLWKVPKDMQKGKGYKIKLTNPQNTGEYIFSSDFEIKSGIPKAIIAVPVVAAASVAYLIIRGCGNGKPPLYDLPPPIDPE